MDGVANADADNVNTMIAPERMPGISCGKIMRKKVDVDVAPRDLAACSILPVEPLQRTPDGNDHEGQEHMLQHNDHACHGEQQTNRLVYKTDPEEEFTKPRLPSRTDQPRVRTTTEISNGPRMIAKKDPRQSGVIRDRINVSGTPRRMQMKVTPSAMPAVRRNI